MATWQVCKDGRQCPSVAGQTCSGKMALLKQAFFLRLVSAGLGNSGEQSEMAGGQTEGQTPHYRTLPGAIMQPLCKAENGNWDFPPLPA